MMPNDFTIQLSDLPDEQNLDSQFNLSRNSQHASAYPQRPLCVGAAAWSDSWRTLIACLPGQHSRYPHHS